MLSRGKSLLSSVRLHTKSTFRRHFSAPPSSSSSEGQQLTTATCTTYGTLGADKATNWRYVGKVFAFLFLYGAADTAYAQTDEIKTVDHAEFEYRLAVERWMKRQVEIHGEEKAKQIYGDMDPWRKLDAATYPDKMSYPNLLVTEGVPLKLQHHKDIDDLKSFLANFRSTEVTKEKFETYKAAYNNFKADLIAVSQGKYIDPSEKLRLLEEERRVKAAEEAAVRDAQRAAEDAIRIQIAQAELQRTLAEFQAAIKAQEAKQFEEDAAAWKKTMLSNSQSLSASASASASSASSSTSASR